MKPKPSMAQSVIKMDALITAFFTDEHSFCKKSCKYRARRIFSSLSFCFCPTSAHPAPVCFVSWTQSLTCPRRCCQNRDHRIGWDRRMGSSDRIVGSDHRIGSSDWITGSDRIGSYQKIKKCKY